MDKEFYRVEREDYIGFLQQIKPHILDKKIIENPDCTIINFYSQLTNKLLCSHEIFQKQGWDDHYYIYEMPEDEERGAAVRVRKINLKTREEVQTFFNIISELQKND